MECLRLRTRSERSAGALRDAKSAGGDGHWRDSFHPSARMGSVTVLSIKAKPRLNTSPCTRFRGARPVAHLSPFHGGIVPCLGCAPPTTDLVAVGVVGDWRGTPAGSLSRRGTHPTGGKSTPCANLGRVRAEKARERKAPSMLCAVVRWAGDAAKARWRERLPIHANDWPSCAKVARPTTCDGNRRHATRFRMVGSTGTPARNRPPDLSLGLIAVPVPTALRFMTHVESVRGRERGTWWKRTQAAGMRKVGE